jgi:plastocyanin
VQASSVSDAASARAAPHATLDQVNKTFVPGVLPIVVGTEVRFPNHDQIHHHVYSFSRTKSFELPLYKGQDAPPVLFDKAGVVKVGCNIHDWMSAVILVLPTTHYAETDDEGRFTLSDLPAGQYTLAAWHELSRDKVEDTLQQVQTPSGTAEVNFTLALAPAKTRPAMHGLRRDQ